MYIHVYVAVNKVLCCLSFIHSRVIDFTLRIMFFEMNFLKGCSCMAIAIVYFFDHMIINAQSILIAPPVLESCISCLLFICTHNMKMMINLL